MKGKLEETSLIQLDMALELACANKPQGLKMITPSNSSRFSSSSRQSLYLFLAALQLVASLILIANAQQQPAQQAPTIQRRQAALTPGTDNEYLVGVGIADITGPSADINLVSLLSQLFEMTSELLVSAPTNSSPSSSLSLSSSSVASKRKGQAGTGTQNTTTKAQQGPVRKRPPERHKVKTTATMPNVERKHFTGPLMTNLISDTLKPFESSKPKRTTRELRPNHDPSVADKKQATISMEGRPLMSIQYPSWRDLQNVKLQLKVNLNNFLTNIPPPPSTRRRHLTADPNAIQTRQSGATASATALNPLVADILRWAMPSQLKMQAEYTYVNLVVRL